MGRSSDAEERLGATWGLCRELVGLGPSLQELQALCDLALVCAGKGQDFCGSEMKETMSELVGVMFHFPQELQDKLSTVGEVFWKSKLEGKETLIGLPIQYLLFRCMNQDCDGKIVERLFHVRTALNIFDFSDSSSDTLKHMLLQCMINPLLLGNGSFGRKFLAYLFTVDKEFLYQLHLAVKGHIALSSKKVAECYAEIYYLAWSALSSKPVFAQHLLSFESECIQDLMHKCVLVAVKKTASIMFHFIASLNNFKFQDHANVSKFEAMLTHLWEPILWRFIKAPNPIVRHNAYACFFISFPVLDSHQSVRIRDEELASQIRLLVESLKEDSAQVRELAAREVPRILSLFWSIFPLAAASEIVNTLVEDLAFDFSSEGSKVRSSAINGIKSLLSNSSSHAMIIPKLKLLEHHIFDSSSCSRSKTLELLIFIRDKVPSVKFYDFISEKNILAALAVEKTESNQKRFAELLQPSYFPDSKSDLHAEDLSRCLVLISENHFAAYRLLLQTFFWKKKKELLQVIQFLISFIWPENESERENTRQRNPRKKSKAALERMTPETRELVFSILLILLQRALNSDLKESVMELIDIEKIFEDFGPLSQSHKDIQAMVLLFCSSEEVPFTIHKKNFFQYLNEAFISSSVEQVQASVRFLVSQETPEIFDVLIKALTGQSAKALISPDLAASLLNASLFDKDLALELVRNESRLHSMVAAASTLAKRELHSCILLTYLWNVFILAHLNGHENSSVSELGHLLCIHLVEGLERLRNEKQAEPSRRVKRRKVQKALTHTVNQELESDIILEGVRLFFSAVALNIAVSERSQVCCALQELVSAQPLRKSQLGVDLDGVL